MEKCDCNSSYKCHKINPCIKKNIIRRIGLDIFLFWTNYNLIRNSYVTNWSDSSDIVQRYHSKWYSLRNGRKIGRKNSFISQVIRPSSSRRICLDHIGNKIIKVKWRQKHTIYLLWFSILQSVTCERSYVLC